MGIRKKRVVTDSAKGGLGICKRRAALEKEWLVSCCVQWRYMC